MDELIQQWLSLADKRNLSVDNPVTIRVIHEAKTFYVCVSHTEPNRVTLPLNVLWLVADQESVHANRVLRRVSSVPSTEFRGTWAQIPDLEELYASEQFWDTDASFTLGEIDTNNVGIASETVRGFFYLTDDAADPADPIVVCSDDPRMRDARQPTSHTHELEPFTEIVGATGINTYIVGVSSSRPPIPGQILSITEITTDELGQKHARGEWVNVSSAMIDYDGAVPLEIIISTSTGESTVNESDPIVFSAEVAFDDSTTIGNVPVTWSIVGGQEFAIINSSTGEFVGHDIVGDRVIRVRAQWRHAVSNTELVADFDITVVDTTVVALLTGIELQGVQSIDEGSHTTAFTVMATYDDGTSRAVTPDTLTTSNPDAGTLNPTTGIFTSAQNVNSNQITQIGATYSERGITQSDEITLTVIDRTVYPASATIVGPNTVSENTTAQFQLNVLFTDGTSSYVSVSNWSSSTPTAGSIDPVSGVFTAVTNLDENVLTTLSASFTSNGQTVSANRSLTVTDDTVYPRTAVILGSNTVNEGQNATYQLQVTFSNDVVQIVVVDNWTSSDSGIAAINANTGVFTAQQVSANSPVDISASYTMSGETVSATRTINVIDTTNYPVSLVIQANPSMAEGSQQTAQATCTYLDGTTALVPVLWSTSDSAVATVNASGVIVAVANLLQNTNVIINASYTEHGTTVTDSIQIAVLDTTVYPVSATIVGPVALAEGTSQQYQLRVVFDNGTNEIIAVTNWASSDPAAGTITNNGLFTAVLDVDVNTPTTLTASYTRDGRNVTGSLNVTVTDATIYPVNASIIGANSVNEGDATTFLFRVIYSDANTQDVVVTNWASTNVSAGSINPATGVFTAAQQTENVNTTISASYTELGITVSDEKVLTVVDTTVYPVSAVIVGPNSINEGSSNTFVFRVTFNDNHTEDVAISNWATSNPAAGVIAASTGFFQATLNVQSDITTTLSGSYTADGRTVPANKSLTVSDTTAYPVSAVITGPATVDEDTSAQYEMRVTFDNGQTSVVAGNWTSSNPAAGEIDPTTGEFTAVTDVSEDIATVLTAEYSVDGQSVDTTRTISVRDTTVYPQTGTIAGPTTIDEGEEGGYQLNVNYSDGTTQEVAAAWSITSGGAYATIDAETGVVTTIDNIIGDKAIVVRAEYTESGVQITDTHNVTIVDTIKRPVSLVIAGPEALPETDVHTFVAGVTYDDGSTAPVTALWTSSNPSAGTININSGEFTPADVGINIGTTIIATYTEHGIEVIADHELTVEVVFAPVSAVAVGPTSIDEASGEHQYTLLVTFENDSETAVAATWTLDNAEVGTVDAETGVLTAATNTIGDKTGTLIATYTANGVEVSDDITVTLVDTVFVPVSAVITGPATVDEEVPTDFVFTVTYDNGTTADLTASATWSSSDEAVASVDSGTVTGVDVSEDTEVTISAEITINGATVSGDITITVIDNTLNISPRYFYGAQRFGGLDLKGTGAQTPDPFGGPAKFWNTQEEFLEEVRAMGYTEFAAGEVTAFMVDNETAEPPATYLTVAHPAWMGYPVFRLQPYDWVTTLTGATWMEDQYDPVTTDPDGGEGPVHVIYDDGHGEGPIPWCVWRSQFPNSGNWDLTVTFPNMGVPPSQQ